MIIFYIFMMLCLQPSCAMEAPYACADQHHSTHDFFSPGTIIDYETSLKPLFTSYFKNIEENHIRNTLDHWVNNTNSPLFVQKTIVEPNTQVVLFGDLHGDLKALNGMLKKLIEYEILDPQNPFVIKDPCTRLVFLGDYVDRGEYGIEIIATLLKLINSNPYNRVLLARGNHEDIHINQSYGFDEEITTKYPTEHENIKDFAKKFYTTLPLAIYLGCGSNPTYYALCCHGAHELGFDPKKLLEHSEPVAFCDLGSLNRSSKFHELQKLMGSELIDKKRTLEIFKNVYKPVLVNEDYIFDIGFTWADLVPTSNRHAGLSYRKGRTFMYGWCLHQMLLKVGSTPLHKVITLWRAHQHSGEETDILMNRISNQDQQDFPQNAGIGRMWPDKFQPQDAYVIQKGSAYTFSAPPLEDFPQVLFATFGIVKFFDSYKKWQLTAHRVDKKDL